MLQSQAVFGRSRSWGGGTDLNAADHNPFVTPDRDRLMLAVALALADLAGEGDRLPLALDRLAAETGRALTLRLGQTVLRSGGALGITDSMPVIEGDAVLDGIPAELGKAEDAALRAFLRAVCARHQADAQARARGRAATDILFEVTDQAQDSGWWSVAAQDLFAQMPDLRQMLADTIAAVLARPDQLMLCAVPTAQRPRHFMVSAHPAGQQGRWLIRLQERTEEMRLQGKLERRDLLARRLFDASPVGVVLISFASGKILEANTAFTGFGSWSREALVGQSILTLVPEEQATFIDRALADLRSDGRFGPYEQTLVRPDGSSFPAVLRGLLIITGSGEGIVWLLIEDLSEQRAYLAEVQAVRDEALRARSELHTAVQALPHGFVLFDAEDRIVMVNDQMATVYPELAPALVPGRLYEDALRDGVARGIFPAAIGREEEFVAETMLGRKAPVIEVLTELAGDRVMHVLERSTPTGGRVGLRIDVTPERNSERRLSQVIDGSQAGTWECDLLTGDNWVNDRWAGMLGWTKAELGHITLTSFRALVHPEDAAVMLDNTEQVLRQQTDVADLTFRLRHRDGHWVWVQSRGRVAARAADGTPTRMAGVHIDISALKAAEQRLDHIIEGAEVGTWHHDMREGICHVNDLWVRMLGYTIEELGPVTDAVWEGLLHPDDWVALNRNMRARIATATWRFQDELRLRHKDGHWVWVLSSGRVSEWDDMGVPVATSGVHLDISARKRLEGDLERERDFLSTLMETSVSGIMAVDYDARILFFNREVLRILEVPSEALMHRVLDPVALNLTDMDGNPVSFAGLPCQISQRTGQTVRDMRLRIAMPDGRIKVVSVNAAMLPDQAMVARVVCTITDVTATARSEDDLRAAIARAEAASQTKSQFLANMSHELRTPLNGVLGMADLLAEGGLDPSQRAMLETIRECGVHLLSIVNDLLDLAKIESGKLVLEIAPVRLTDLAARIEAMHGLEARRKGIALHVTFGAGAERTRMGDATRLLQILHNLVGNAVKFTETGAVKVTIQEDPASPDRLLVTVSDTGIGMSDDQTAMVFEDFTQGDGSISRRFGGTGLGLPIVRRLVGLMDGEVDLVSVKGRGTTVTVKLAMSLCLAERPANKPPPVVQFRGMRALLAEDNPTNRLIIRAMLTRLGVQVSLATDGDEAVALYQPDRFELILLDISMPRKDGLTALADLRQKAGPRGLPPVLAVTANAREQDKQDYRAAGFADVVTKPVTIEALAAAIQRAGHTFDAMPDFAAPER
jgi:PAS domain S-box-containing protein